MYTKYGLPDQVGRLYHRFIPYQIHNDVNVGTCLTYVFLYTNHGLPDQVDAVHCSVFIVNKKDRIFSFLGFWLAFFFLY